MVSKGHVGPLSMANEKHSGKGWHKNILLKKIKHKARCTGILGNIDWKHIN